MVKLEDHNFVLDELLNMAISNSGCTQTVCEKRWLEIYKETLPEEVKAKLELEESSRVFKFGDGDTITSVLLVEKLDCRLLCKEFG